MTPTADPNEDITLHVKCFLAASFIVAPAREFRDNHTRHHARPSRTSSTCSRAPAIWMPRVLPPTPEELAQHDLLSIARSGVPNLVLTGPNGRRCIVQTTPRFRNEMMVDRSVQRGMRLDQPQRNILLAHPAVGIEPSLRRQSPENGNICGAGQRLSAIWPTKGAKWEDGDRLQVRESPPMAGFSRIPRSVPTKARLPGWRRSGIRTNLQRNFPANREFNREFYVFGPSEANFVARNPCAAGVSRAIPYAS